MPTHHTTSTTSPANANDAWSSFFDHLLSIVDRADRDGGQP